MEKRAKQAVVGTIAVILVMLTAGIIWLVNYLSPGTEVMSLSDYYQIPEGEVLVIMDDKIYEKNALLLEGHIYIDLNTVQQRFNKRFYWDTNENLLIYTTPTEVIKAGIGSSEYQVDKNRESISHSVVRTIGSEVYVSLEFTARYSDIRYREETVMTAEGNEVIQRVLITCTYADYLYVDVTKATQIRTEANRKSEILKEMEAGEQLMVIDGGGTLENGYLKVMSEDGVRGFIQNKRVSEGYYSRVESTYTAPVYTSIQREETINMVWHLVTNETANDNLMGMLANTKGLTTISPTWFSISSNEGMISSLASESYVTLAHQQGLEVWGLVDNFNTQIDSYQILSRTSSREKLVNEIIAAAIRFNLDGINIDFENLSLETGPHFIQFLRELSIKCRNNRLILSVDNYVPASYNKYYDYAEQGILVDYVVIMAYDEHYAGSEEAGSVASISYVENAIADTCDMVAKEKIIMAVPFYNRLWKETLVDGVMTLSSEALGMESTVLTLEANNAVPVWDETTCQYYAEYEKDGTSYKIWLEEEESIDAKVSRIHAADLAGVAAWRLGYEKSTIWDVILKYVN